VIKKYGYVNLFASNPRPVYGESITSHVIK